MSFERWPGTIADMTLQDLLLQHAVACLCSLLCQLLWLRACCACKLKVIRCLGFFDFLLKLGYLRLLPG